MENRSRKKPVYDLTQAPVEGQSGRLEKLKLEDEKDEGGMILKENETFEYEASGDDTLATIAAANMTTASELLRINKLLTPIIHPGQFIKVPKRHSSESSTQYLDIKRTSHEDIKSPISTTKLPMTRQRSRSEYHRPQPEFLAVPSPLEKFNKGTKSRKVSLAVLVESVRNKLSGPSSAQNVSSQKLRTRSVVVAPKSSHLEFSLENKRRKLSEANQHPPAPVTFLSEVIFPDEDHSTGSIQLDGETLAFESICGNYSNFYVYYSIKYENIISIAVFSTNSSEPNFSTLDQLEIVNMSDGLRNISTSSEGTAGSTNVSSKSVEYFMRVKMSKDGPCYLLNEKVSDNLWFSVEKEKLFDVDRHLRLAIPHSYSNLPEETKNELLYDLKIKLLKFEIVNTNQKGDVNAFVKFKVERTTIYKSRTIHGGLCHEYNESFTVENIIPDDVIRIKTYAGSDVGISTIFVSSLSFKVEESLKLQISGSDKEHQQKFGFIYLQCGLFPKGSPPKFPCVPYPRLDHPSQILSNFHVAKLTDSLPSILTSSQNWKIIYSNMEHGSSLLTLYSKMSDCSPDECVILVIKDSEQKIFGAFLTTPIKPCRSFYGNGECFLFTFHPEFQKYQWSGTNMCIVRSDEGGISIGCGKSGDGLWIHENICDGSTHASETFDSLPLIPGTTFRIHIIETFKIEV